MAVKLLLLCLLAVWVQSGNAILRKEFRIALPFTAEQYRIGHLWSTAEWSIRNTGGSEGVEIVTNEPYFNDEYRGKGQYTHKIHHLSSKVPKTVQVLAPRGSLEMKEDSWNAFPYVKTVITNPEYMKDGFHVTTYTKVVENDDCTQDNIFDNIYDGAREVNMIDIVNDPVSERDYNADEDPTKCRSDKLNLGPLTQDWKIKDSRLCVYKFMEVEFIWWGLQRTVEYRIMKFAPRFYGVLHRQMFCWADRWADLTIEEIREIEKFTKQELNKIRRTGDVVGMIEV